MKKQMMKSALIALAGVGLMSSVALADGLGNGTTSISTTGFNGEDSLQKIINDSFSAFTSDVVGGQSGVGLWSTVDAGSTIYRVDYLFNNEIGKLGIYDPSDFDKKVLLSATGTNDYATFTFSNGELVVNGNDTNINFGSSFGFYYQINNTTSTTTIDGKPAADGLYDPIVYTENSANSDKQGHAVTYLVPDGTNVLFNWDGGSLVNTVASGDDDWVIAFELNNYSSLGTDRWDFNDAVFFVKDMNAVPEPTTMLLFGTGLLGLAGVARRKICK